MTFVERCDAWLGEELRHTRGVRILQFAVGCVLLFRVSTEIRAADYLWGPQGLGAFSSSMPLFGEWATEVTEVVFATELSTLAVLIALFLGAVGLIVNVYPRLASAVALIGFLMLEIRLPELLDGGDNLVRLVLFYMLFLQFHGAKEIEAGRMKVWLHNLAVVAIALQLFIVYGVAGLLKVHGDLWFYGTAMYYVSQVEWFSYPPLREMFKNPFVTTAASYGTVLYEVLFPLAILSRLKLCWIFVGVVFHIGIAVFMGLLPFSTIMIGLTLFLITDEEFSRIEARVGRSIDWVKHRSRNLVSLAKGVR